MMAASVAYGFHHELLTCKIGQRGEPCVCATSSHFPSEVELLNATSKTTRRYLLVSAIASVLPFALDPLQPSAAAASTADGAIRTSKLDLKLVADPATYSALAYAPHSSSSLNDKPPQPPPLLIVLHGAAQNAGTAWDLADINGEHMGLPPSLIASNTAPSTLTQNFAVVTPYSAGKRSFYEEPRSKILQFIRWVCSDDGRAAGCPLVDTSRVFLLGFSDGATLGVELLTTGRFRGGVIAAYGFTGTLPALALERLKGVPIWVFHSADDAIFPVSCSDRLIDSLRKVNDGLSGEDMVKYTRFDRDQEGFTGRVRGHSTGITASKDVAIYQWMLSV